MKYFYKPIFHPFNCSYYKVSRNKYITTNIKLQFIQILKMLKLFEA